MQVGLVLPQGYFNEFEGWEPRRAWARIVELAQTAERLGFESIWTGEHVLSKWPGESIAFDCWALSSGLAPLVPRVGIGLIVMNSTFHNPAMTAKAAVDARRDQRRPPDPRPWVPGSRRTRRAPYGHDYPRLRDRMEWLSEHFEIIWRATRQDEPRVLVRGDVRPRRGPREQPACRARARGQAPDRRPRQELHVPARRALLRRAQPQRLPGRGARRSSTCSRERCAEIGRDPSTVELNCGHEPDHALQGPQGDRRPALRRAPRAGLPGSGKGRRRRHPGGGAGGMERARVRPDAPPGSRASTTPTRACTSSSTTAGRPGSTSSIGQPRPTA